MKNAIENLKEAQARGFAGRPKVGGFPYLAETLRQAGVRRNEWFLPSCQSIYLTDQGPVLSQGSPLVSGMVDIPRYDADALVQAINIDKAGKSDFGQFLRSTWEAGVVRYTVDFDQRTVSYYGAEGEEYLESYAPVTELLRESL
jgi:uncharacterized protein YbcV (DUF1398 family)